MPALALLLSVLSPSWADASDEIRTWTSADGREIQASLLSIDGDSIEIRRSDGFRFSIGLDQLSEADREFIEDLKKKSLQEAIDWRKPENSESYNIRGVRESRMSGYIKTEEGWEQEIEAIEVIVEYEGDRNQIQGNVCAYFYDRDDILIQKYPRSARYEVKTNEYADPVKKLTQGERYEYYFPLSKFLVERDWKTVLIVFSGPDGMSAETDPKSSFEPFAFDEKKKLFPAWDGRPTEDSPGPRGPVGDYTLVIDKVKKSKWDDSMWFNEDWRHGRDCIETRVKVEDAVPFSEVKIHLYLYDKDNRKVGQRKIPSMVHIGNREYVKVAKIAEEDEWYPAVFALDKELEDLDWRTAVVTFSIGDQCVAEVYSRSGATIEDLSFPEKSHLSHP